MEATNKNRRIPIVAISADIRQELLKKSSDAGMDSFITKPIEIKRLLETIEKFSTV